MNFRHKVGTILAGTALAAATTLGSASAATNLLTNGDLKPTTAGWTRVGTGTFQTVPGIGATLAATEATTSQSSVYANPVPQHRRHHVLQVRRRCEDPDRPEPHRRGLLRQPLLHG